MKVILKEAVPTLGKAGEVKEVRMGYGFNFLLPRGLAEIATPGNIKRILRRVEVFTKRRAVEMEKLSATVKKLEGVTITIKMKSQEGKLFGSVGPTLIVEALKAQGYDIVDEAIDLAKPLKKIGNHPVTAKAGDTQATFTVKVEAE